MAWSNFFFYKCTLLSGLCNRFFCVTSFYTSMREVFMWAVIFTLHFRRYVIVVGILMVVDFFLHLCVKSWHSAVDLIVVDAIIWIMNFYWKLTF